MSVSQLMVLQTLGWQAVVKTGKGLGQNAKWNVTIREPDAQLQRRPQVWVNDTAACMYVATDAWTPSADFSGGSQGAAQSLHGLAVHQ